MRSGERGYQVSETTTPRELTRVRIYQHVTRDRVLDISDMLSLEPKRSRIALTLVEMNEHGKILGRGRFYADATDFKLVCWDILHQPFGEWTGKQGGIGSDCSELLARVVTIRKDVKYRQPYVLKIDNGVGEAMLDGAVKMINATASLTVLMPEWDARRMAQTVLDYIHQWEVVNFRKRQDAQTMIIPADSEATR